MKVYLYNPENNRAKGIKWGVSWVYLFFGGWALLFSGRWLYIAIEICLNLLIFLAGAGAPLTFIYHVFLFIFGNKTYAKYLVSKGWKPAGEADARILGIPFN